MTLTLTAELDTMSRTIDVRLNSVGLHLTLLRPRLSRWATSRFPRPRDRALYQTGCAGYNANVHVYTPVVAVSAWRYRSNPR